PQPWSLVSIGQADCDDPCLNRLYWQRQIISSLGRDQSLVTGIWLILGDKDLGARLLDHKRHLQFWRVNSELLQVKFLPITGRNLNDDYYLIDAQGHWVIRFPAVHNPQEALKLKKDLLQLLRVNRIWQRYG
ncbi:MAG: hypothetical protein QM520_02375, partial [Gammaproteobacteria bacterium]|nr:hypothetical protein [Gammaproteobacteria bacterium]